MLAACLTDGTLRWEQQERGIHQLHFQLSNTLIPPYWIKQLLFVALIIKYRFSTSVTVSAQHSHVAFQSFLLIPSNPASHRLLPGNMCFCLSSCPQVKMGSQNKRNLICYRKFRSRLNSDPNVTSGLKKIKIITHNLSAGICTPLGFHSRG